MRFFSKKTFLVLSMAMVVAGGCASSDFDGEENNVTNNMTTGTTGTVGDTTILPTNNGGGGYTPNNVNGSNNGTGGGTNNTNTGMTVGTTTSSTTAAACDMTGFDNVDSPQNVIFDDNNTVIVIIEQNGGSTFLQASLLPPMGGGFSPFLGPGKYNIGDDPADANYGTCTTCVLIGSGCDANNNCATYFVGTKGTIDIDFIIPGENVAVGDIEDLELTEVTLAPDTFASTPVPGGATWCIDDVGFNTIL